MQLEVKTKNILGLLGLYKPSFTRVYNTVTRKFMIAFVEGISDNNLHLYDIYRGNIIIKSNCDLESYAEMEKISKILCKYKYRFMFWRLFFARVYSLIKPNHCNFFIPENKTYEVIEWVINNCSIYEYAFSTKYKSDITLCLEHKKAVIFKLWFDDK